MNKNKKILIGPSTFAKHDRTPFNMLEELPFEIVDNPYKRRLTKEELFELLDVDVVGLVAGLEPLDREVLSKSSLKVLSRSGSGMSNVDMDAAEELGIKVFSTPYGPTNSVAELTIGSLLSLFRDIHNINSSMHNRNWEKEIGLELKGKKLAIIGYGKIGQRVGFLADAFGAEIIAVDPQFQNNNDLNVKKMEFEEALKEADIISLHCSGEDPILRQKEFSLMKKGMFLLNAGRGGLVEESALIEALENNIIRGAWLDTFVEEPYSGPLCDFKQVLLTSHIGSFTTDCRKSMEKEAVENLIKGLEL